MTGALRELMAGLVDYAGLFPPASLDMAVAARNYATYRAGPHRWMLGKFILPAGRLDQLAEVLPAQAIPGDPWPLSLLVGGGDPADITVTLADQIRTLGRFLARFPDQASVKGLEAPLPAGLDQTALRDYLGAFTTALAAGGPTGACVYLELPAAGDDDPGYLEALAAFRDGTGFPGPLGAKLRMGGVAPEAFPSVERVAAIQHAAARLGLPVKYTAGLHHPVRHEAQDPPVMMYGFLNVFVGGLLAAHAQASRETLAAVLSETDGTRFHCGAADLGWAEHRVPLAAVTTQRETALPGFGSCSFTEPLDDLAALNLL